jgi:hypothetical protein
MTTNFRTLLLLGLTALTSGCIVETTSSGPGYGSPACLDSQFFDVDWGADHGPGTIPLTCADLSAMGSSVRLTTTAAPPFDTLRPQFFLDCRDGVGRVCSDGSPCNSQGTTAAGVPAGTEVVMAELVDVAGNMLSTADGPTGCGLGGVSGCALPSCHSLILGFPFTLP